MFCLLPSYVCHATQIPLFSTWDNECLCSVLPSFLLLSSGSLKPLTEAVFPCIAHRNVLKRIEQKVKDTVLTLNLNWIVLQMLPETCKLLFMLRVLSLLWCYFSYNLHVYMQASMSLHWSTNCSICWWYLCSQGWPSGAMGSKIGPQMLKSGQSGGVMWL